MSDNYDELMNGGTVDVTLSGEEIGTVIALCQLYFQLVDTEYIPNPGEERLYFLFELIQTLLASIEELEKKVIPANFFE